VCGTTDALSARPDGSVRCYEHLAGDAAAVEADHVAGRANLGGLTVGLRGNAHRAATDQRRQLGIDAWPPAEGDPLLALAHFLGGLATILWLVARWLVELAAWLAGRLGARWWTGGPPFPLG
jgi:hypothetical protein